MCHFAALHLIFLQFVSVGHQGWYPQFFQNCDNFASSPGPASPPVSPSRNLGPVGSRPSLNTGLEAGDRAQQFTNLCNIFPRAQVEAVMTLLPHEKDTAVLCKKIVELFK